MRNINSKLVINAFKATIAKYLEAKGIERVFIDMIDGCAICFIINLQKPTGEGLRRAEALLEALEDIANLVADNQVIHLWALIDSLVDSSSKWLKIMALESIFNLLPESGRINCTLTQENRALYAMRYGIEISRSDELFKKWDVIRVFKQCKNNLIIPELHSSFELIKQDYDKKINISGFQHVAHSISGFFNVTKKRKVEAGEFLEEDTDMLLSHDKSLDPGLL